MTKTKDMEPIEVIHVVKEIVPSALLPLPDAASAALVCVFAFAAAAQQPSTVLMRHAPFFAGISFVAIVELSAEFLAVFVFMRQGQGESLVGLHPSGARRHFHPVALRHAPSFQQFGFQVLWCVRKWLFLYP